MTIEADQGSGFATAATTIVGEDGGFMVSVTPHASLTYRARAGGATSPAFHLLVLDHRVSISTRRLHGGRVQVSARVTPADPRATVVLQLRLRDRFGWWPVRTMKLDRSSRARFTALRLKKKHPARVLLTLDDGATPLARSRVVHVGPAGH